MQCNKCGYMLPAGAQICPGCASPTLYNVGEPAPTQYAPPYNPPSQPDLYSSPSQPNYGQPPTQYTTSPPTPYAAPPPPYVPPPPYGSPPSSYGLPPNNPPSGPYGSPPVMPYMPPPKKGPGAGLIIGILLLVVVLCGGGVWALQYFLVAASSHTANSVFATATALVDDTYGYSATATTYAAPTSPPYTAPTSPPYTPPAPYSESQPPSGRNFSGMAQRIITNAQMASAVDSNNFPTQISSTFRPNQTFYVAFTITAGNAGYVMSVWYSRGNASVSSAPLSIAGRSGDGYFSESYTGPNQGAVELYWCASTSCSDKQLAWVRAFQIVE